MSDNARLTLIFFWNLLLYFIIGELNFFLGGISLHLHADTLLLLFFGLYLNRMSGLVSAVLLGFLTDAVSPVPYGTYVVGYLLIWLFLVWSQRRIRRQHQVHVRSVAAATQFLWMGALSLVLLATGTHLGAQRVIVEILFSCGVTYALAWPWCRFQKKFLYSIGWNIEAQMSPY